MEINMQAPPKTEIELPHDLAMPFSGICLKDSILAALFTTAKKCNQSAFPSTDEFNTNKKQINR